MGPDQINDNNPVFALKGRKNQAMSKCDAKRLKPRRSSNTGRAVKRAAALVLCAAMMASLITFALPTRVSAADGDVSPVDFDKLYIREADKNTMDSYVQGSLGGFIYKKRIGGVDAVTTPTVRNNFGSRYAGQVWADLSVFARNQKVVADIHPFEEGKSYTTELTRLMELGVALTAQQANSLNALANGLVNPNSYSYTGDGDFNGTRLQLERHTDGVTSYVDINDLSDFLNVFSVLGSSQLVNDQLPTPLDVVFVLDNSASMSSTGELYDSDGVGGIDRGRYWTEPKESLPEIPVPAVAL